MRTNAHRRVISPFFSLILVLALLGAGIGIAAAANPIVSITPAAKNVNVGDVFEVRIEVDPNGNNLQMAKVGLTYDSTLVTMAPATNGGMFTTSFGAGSDDGAGTVTNIYGTGPGTSTTGNLAVLHMTAVSAGTFDLVLFDATTGTEGGQLTPDVNSGTVTIEVGDNPIVSITPTTKNVDIGDVFEVYIEVDPNGNNLQMVNVNLTYDSTLVTMAPATNGGMFTTSFGAGSDDGAGTVTNIFGTGPGTSTTGYLAVLHMTADSVGTFDLVLSGATAGTAGGQLTPSVNSGTVIVTDNDPPTVTVTSPVSGTVSGTIDVTATATDTDGTVTQVAFYLMPAGTLIGTDADSTGGWSVPLDTTTVADGTGYQIKAVATDNEGATGDDTGSVFAIDNSCQCDFCLDLEAGWNFVSVPNTLNGSNDANTVFNLTLGETCLYYDCVDGWKSNSAVSVVPCQGYWVGKVASDQICLDFDPGTGAITPPEQNLCQGWNMIGHIHTSTMPVDDGSAADFGSITTLEDNFAQIWQWTQSGGWECYPLGGFTDMTPGQGYWILTTEATPMYGTK